MGLAFVRGVRGVEGIGRLLTLAGSVGLAHQAIGQQTFTDWVGPADGLWTSVANWSSIVPTSPGHVFLLNGGMAQLNTNIVVDKFGLGGGTLNVNNIRVLGVRTQSGTDGVTGIFGGGNINLNSVGNATYLRVYLHQAGATDPYVLHGNSGNPTFINMSNTTANIIDGDTLGLRFVNEGTIQGSGQFGTNILNIENTATGVIQSTHGGGNLILDAFSTIQNNGVIRSTGGTLTIQNSGVTQLGTGEIGVNSITPAVVDVVSSTIMGGRFQNSGSSPSTHYMQLRSNSVIDGISVEGAIRIPNNNLAFTRNGFSGPGSKVYLDSVGNATYLRLLNDQTLSGTCGIECSNTQANIIDANSTNLVLTNDLLGGIRGSFQLGTNTLSVVNNTFVESAGSAGVTIDPPSGGFVNNGIIRSTPNSPMTLTGGTFTNTNGDFVAQNPSTFTLSAVRVEGGDLIGEQPGGVFQALSNSTLAGVTFAASTFLNVPNNHLCFFEGTITNHGTINLSSVGNGTYFRTFAGDVFLTGGGTIHMTNSQANIFDASVLGQRMTNQDNVIRGSAQICADSLQFVNNSLIEAEGSAGIRIDPPSVFGFDNNGSVRALSDSSVLITSGFFDNDGASLEAQDGSVITVQAATINAGTIRSLGSGYISTQSNSVFVNPTIDTGTVTNTPNNHLCFYQGSVVNHGEINLASVGNGTYFRTSGGNVLLTGGGTLRMTNSLANIIDASVLGQRLTNQDNVIRGSGQMCTDTLQFVNNSLILAEGSQGIRIDPPSTFGFDNNGIVRAASGSNVLITSGFFDNDGALIEAQDGSSITVQAATINSGVMRSLGSASFSIQSNSTLVNTTLDVGTVTNTPNNHLTFYQGMIVNRGTINLNSIGNGTFFRTAGGDVTLTGGGSVAMSNTTANIIDASVLNQRLINQNNTIHGSGQVGTNTMSVTNRGAIVCDLPAGIIIDPPSEGSFLNDTTGLLRASGGNITIHAGPFSTAGIVIADSGRLIQRTSESWTQASGLVLANGEVQVDSNNYLLQGGVLGGTGRVDSDVVNTGGTLSPGASSGSMIIEGNYTQQLGGGMLIEVNGEQPGDFDVVTITGTANLDGTLTVVNGTTPEVGATFDVLIAATRTGTFSTVSALGYSVQYLPNRVRLVYDGLICDSIDFNNDTSLFDPADIDAFLSVFSEGHCIPETAACNDIDFNNDGSFFDPCDIDSFLRVFSEGPCTVCGV